MKLNSYIITSLILLGIFVLLAAVVYYGERFSINYNNIDNYTNKNFFASFVNVDKSARLIFYNNPANPLFFQFMKFMTDYGREFFWPIVIILFLIFGGRDLKAISILMIISFIVVIPATTISKEIIDRTRPDLTNIDINNSNNYTFANGNKENDSSFPSGHASLVSAGALAASMLLLLRNSIKQKIISILLIFEAGLVCFSRLYLGAHYPLDIIGGITLGCAVTIFFANYMKFYNTIADKIKLNRVIKK